MDRTTETLARYANTLRYGDLGASAVQAAKRRLIDSLGCAIGRHGSEPAAHAGRPVSARPAAPPGATAGAPAAIARRLAPVWSGAPSARLLGDGRATTPEA